MKEQMIKLSEISCVIDRTAGGQGDLQNLAESIKEFGMINAIIVTPLPAEDPAETLQYKVVAGRRRYKAAELLGLEEIRCNIIEEKEDADYIGLVENTNRLEMHPLDEGELFKKLIARGENIEDLTTVYSRSKSGIYQRIKLTDLVPEAKAQYKDGRFTLTQAAQLAILTTDKQQAVLKATKKIRAISGSDFFSFEFTRTLSAKANLKIGRYFDASVCENCTTRTNYSDVSLFPELNNSSDFCLKPACYQKQLEKEISMRLTEAVKANTKEEEEPLAVIILDDNGIFSEKTFTYVDAAGKRQDELPVLKPKEIYILDHYYGGYAGNLKTDELPYNEKQLIKWAFTPFDYNGNWELRKCLLKTDHKEKPKEKEVDQQELQQQEDTKGMTSEEKTAYKDEFEYSTYQANSYADNIICKSVIKKMLNNQINYAYVIAHEHSNSTINNCLNALGFDLIIDENDDANEKLIHFFDNNHESKISDLFFSITTYHVLRGLNYHTDFFTKICKLNDIDFDSLEKEYARNRTQYINEKVAESLKAKSKAAAETENTADGSPENS